MQFHPLLPKFDWSQDEKQQHKTILPCAVHFRWRARAHLKLFVNATRRRLSGSTAAFESKIWPESQNRHHLCQSSYKWASDKAQKWPGITEVFCFSHKNTLKEIGCLNKVENPDSLQRVIERLSFQLRQRWHDVADDITSNKQREITFEDIARFSESKARALNNPIFGNVTRDLKSKGKDPKNHKPRKGENSGIQGDLPNNSVFYGNRNSPAGPDLAKPTPKRHLCNSDHWLTHCREFKKQSVDQRLTFLRKKDLCENCFLSGHTVQSFPKSSYCKIPNCHTKHLTFLHPKVPDRYIGNPPSNENTKGYRRPAEVNNGNANNGYVNSDSCCDLIGAGLSTIVLPIVPVTVKASGSDASVLTYAFLDGGSNTTFCTINLWKS